ncbi:MAG: hypothetical protein ACP5MZ_02340 [Candidatus Micrarchaeia archaeon]
MPFYSFIMLYSIGMLFGVFAMAIPLKMRFGWNRKRYAFALASGLIITIYLYALFFSYKYYKLAGIYPLLSISVLVFFGFDVILYKRHIPRKMVYFILAGTLLVALGSFIAGSTGFSFNIALLPFIAIFAIGGGAVDYLYFYKIDKYSIGSKTLTFAIIFLVLGILYTAAKGFRLYVPPVAALIVIIAGFINICALIFSLHAMKLYKSKNIAGGVAERNFINNFTYLDTVFVLIGSVIIGSFTYQEVFGGVIIFIGVLVIERAKSLHKERRLA